MRAVLFAVLLCVVGAGFAQAAEAWITFSDPQGGGFHVDLPGEPKVTNQPGTAPNGVKYSEIVYEVPAAGCELMFSDSDLSAFPVTTTQALDGAVEGVSDPSDGTVVISVDTISLDGQDGREVKAHDGAGIQYDDRIFFLKGHLYQVLVIRPKGVGSECDADASRFFDSYHLNP